ncbi:MAG: hypothetical protein J7M40_14390 [Planctomycetes bacterium]|nr:hypothetical protein [Planctomycetota bacterium]
MSIKERKKQRRDMGRYEDRSERQSMAARPNFYKQIRRREQLFQHLLAGGRKARQRAASYCRIKGLRYHDAEEIALTLWI